MKEEQIQEDVNSSYDSDMQSEITWRLKSYVSAGNDVFIDDNNEKEESKEARLKKLVVPLEARELD